jgi:hypothetical protein
MPIRRSIIAIRRTISPKKPMIAAPSTFVLSISAVAHRQRQSSSEIAG